MVGEVDKELEDKIDWEQVTGDVIKETKVFA